MTCQRTSFWYSDRDRGSIEELLRRWSPPNRVIQRIASGDIGRFEQRRDRAVGRESVDHLGDKMVILLHEHMHVARVRKEFVRICKNDPHASSGKREIKLLHGLDFLSIGVAPIV